MELAARETIMERDRSVLACDHERVVLRTSMPVRGSRAERIAFGAIAVTAMTALGIAFERFVFGRDAWLRGAGGGFAMGVGVALAFAVDMRLIVRAGGEGVVLERRNVLLGTRRRRVLARLEELREHDVQRVFEDEYETYVLRLRAGDRWLKVWNTHSPDVADEVGQAILEIARRGAA